MAIKSLWVILQRALWDEAAKSTDAEVSSKVEAEAAKQKAAVRNQNLEGK